MFKASPSDNTTLTTGIVVDTNDPQNRARIRVYAPTMGDVPGAPIEHLPWCRQVTSLGGVVNTPTSMSRGAGADSPTKGGVAYGMWGVPKVGATVVVTCLDGDPANRIWIGCMHSMATEHTMPHGRYIGDGGVDGPVSSSEEPIQPLYSNLRKAFNGDTKSFEWNTRAADTSVAGLTQEAVDTGNMSSKKPDTRHGYKESRLNPDLKIPNSPEKNYDPQVYAWVSPGFHAISMEDSPDNCRLKIRTATGHQIIMDDSNERIYISTAEGSNWIEFDQDGTIDIYAEQNVSIHSARSINLTAAESIRLTAGTSVQVVAGNDIRTTSGTETQCIAKTNMRLQSVTGMFAEAGSTINIKSGESTALLVGTTLDIHTKGASKFLSDSTLDILAKGATKLSTDSTLDILASGAGKIKSSNLDVDGGGSIKQTAGTIHLNGPGASAASKAAEAADAKPAEAHPALLTNRVPSHEPWARVGTKHGYTHEQKYPYDSDQIGKENKKRNPHWKR